jgi:hypothetical protein
LKLPPPPCAVLLVDKSTYLISDYGSVKQESSNSTKNPGVYQEIVGASVSEDAEAHPIIDFGAVLFCESADRETTDTQGWRLGEENGSHLGMEFYDVLCQQLGAPIAF